MQNGALRYIVWLFFVLVLAPTLEAQRSVPAPLPIVDANSRFAFKLFRKRTTATPDRNILVAPTGLSLAFGLLDNGSDPETRREIESAFEFTGMDLAEVNDGFAVLRKEMNLVPPPPKKKQPKLIFPDLGGDNPNRLVIADSLWIKRGYFGKQFLNASRDSYGLDLQRLLPSPSPSAQISRWASKKVHRNVPISLGTMALNDFLLVDVTRFHSFWQYGYDFDLSMTKSASFTLPSGQKKNVPMMYKGKNFRYLEGPKFQAVILPYSQNASMYVFLPAEDSSLKELEQTLTAKNWQERLSQFGSREGMVGLPRFKTETGFDVRAALKELGVKRIFEEFSALRPGLTIPEGARLTNAVQKTELSVDEKGTEAISESYSGGVPGGVPGGTIGERPKPFVMIMNHPFFFAIRHNPTGQLLFLGAIVEP